MSSNAGGKWLAKQNSVIAAAESFELPYIAEDDTAKRRYIAPPATYQISESLTNEERISFLIWSQDLPIFGGSADVTR